MKTIVENELELVVSETLVQPDVQQMLLDRFTPFLEQAKDWKERAESLVVTDISQTREMKMAREARLALRELRISADKLRKELKEDSLRYGKAVQGVYNVIEAAITPIETHLEKQEKFKELFELKQREELRVLREELVKDVREYVISNINLGEITEDDFQMLLTGAQLQKKAAEDAKAKEEAERIEREKAEAEERERLRIENERLKKEADEKEKERQAELDRLEYEMRKANIAAAKAKKEAEQKAAEAKAEADRIAAKLKEKEEAEAKAEADRQAAIEAELSKGDKAKLNDLITDLESLKTKFEFKSKKYKILYLAVVELLEKIIVYIKSKN